MDTRIPRGFVAAIVAFGFACSASGLLIDSGDGTGNITAPSPDPGWSYVGTFAQAALSLVYLGNGWVLTANHNGFGDVLLDGVVYPYLPGSEIRVNDPLPPHALSDLLMFRISPYPEWPLLPIAANPPPLGTPLVMIGDGLERGAPTSWDPNGPDPPGPYYGYFWACCNTMRWGTNNIGQYPSVRVYDTEVFLSLFDQNGSTHEAQGANGDSGGAAFAWNGSSYDLAGIMIANMTYSLSQPYQTSLYGNGTYSVDLSFYRGYILLQMPEPVGGLWAGIALTAVLARRRARSRRCRSPK